MPQNQYKYPAPENLNPTRNLSLNASGDYHMIAILVHTGH